MSAAVASPGPLTAHPIIATLISLCKVERYASISWTIGNISYWIRPQVGQAIKVGTSFFKPHDFKSFLATPISTSGSSETEIRMVSPIPANNKLPKASEDLTAESTKGPASVTPKCKG